MVSNATRYTCSVCRKVTIGPAGRTHIKCCHCGRDKRDTERALAQWREAVAMVAALLILAWGVL